MGGESSPEAEDNTYLLRQLDDYSLEGDTDLKRAMSMLRMGRADLGDEAAAVKKAMGMLRMGRSSSSSGAAVDRRAMGMLRMGRRSLSDDSTSDDDTPAKRKTVSYTHLTLPTIYSV